VPRRVGLLAASVPLVERSCVQVAISLWRVTSVVGDRRRLTRSAGSVSGWSLRLWQQVVSRDDPVGRRWHRPCDQGAGSVLGSASRPRPAGRRHPLRRVHGSPQWLARWTRGDRPAHKAPGSAVDGRPHRSDLRLL